MRVMIQIVPENKVHSKNLMIVFSYPMILANRREIEYEWSSTGFMPL